MRPEEWEATVQEMVDQCRRDPEKTIKLLLAWRTELEKEHPLLEPYQIDTMVREVRHRLSSSSP